MGFLVSPSGLNKRSHHELTLRTTGDLDKDKELNLKLAIVSTFYIKLSKVYDVNPYQVQIIWNYDEKSIQEGISGVMSSLEKRGST